MTADLSAEDFATFVGKAFQAAGHSPLLKLVQLDTRVPAGWETSPRKPFTLILRGPAGDLVPEGLYRFTADGRRDFDLYLVPIQTPSRDHQDYQVVFN